MTSSKWILWNERKKNFRIETKYKENDQKGIPNQVALDLKALIGTLQSDLHCRIDGIEFKWDRMSQRSRSNEKRRKKVCFLFSRSNLSQYWSKMLETRTKWKVFVSLVSISELRFDLGSLHGLSFADAQWPSWFYLAFCFLFRFFIHAWDPGATENKSVTN